MKLEQFIDHTLLKQQATEEDIIKVCNEAKEYEFASVCANAYYASTVSKELHGTNVKTCIVVGFPLGATTKEVKAFEAKQAIDNGAQEIDMVINVGAVKSNKYDVIKDEIKAVVDVCNGHALVKVIIETCLLTDDEKIKVCKIAKEANANFVKTSTGFSTGGATVHDVKLMREVVGPDMGVKASGAVRTTEDAMAVIEAGASRIGASSSIAIVNGTKEVNSNY
ncbi:deoxyribose-phosphate aldolase [Clostridium lacusfryxellense]|uniref:deoxyribose-phosphate aldolase n=1 Tax=Clostridium lacusfryxellense TaxID=205328 RepID=UPI001C0BB678|nr:deoxyribose-phosphate aldolase [Clostridium lacusfryxellense]MBU3110594.1 deoxyribose-phosphate aldolase [Clostridium lacusfryxellense]